MPLPLIVGVAVRLAIGAAAKVIAKQAATAAAKRAAAAAAKKAAESAAKKAAAQGLGRQAGSTATRDAAKKAAQTSLDDAAKAAKKKGGKGPPNTAGKHKAKKSPSPKGPCDHLKGGNAKGKGKFRGGAHDRTRKPSGDGMDSHHMPTKQASPLNPKDGPAIKMDPPDHHVTSSNGRMEGSMDYRAAIADLIASGRWRDAMAAEIRDVRRVAREAGDPQKYNEAIREMLDYFRCLEAHNLLP